MDYAHNTFIHSQQSINIQHSVHVKTMNSPSDSVVVNIDLPKTPHHFKLVIGTLRFNLLVFFTYLTGFNKMLNNIYEKTTLYSTRAHNFPEKQNLTGKGKQLVTSRTLPTSKPSSCPVTRAGENSLQCLIIFKITCPDTRSPYI